MPTRTAALGKLSTTAAGTFTVATVPAGHVWILKDFSATNNSNGLTFSISAWVLDSGGVMSMLLIAPTSLKGVSAFAIQRNFVVLAAGDQIQVNPGGGNWTFWASGADLLL
jgi:hypothetical protein